MPGLTEVPLYLRHRAKKGTEHQWCSQLLRNRYQNFLETTTGITEQEQEGEKTLFPHLLKSPDTKETKRLVKGIFNPIGSRKVAMFINS